MTNKEFFQQCWKAEVAPTITALKALPSADKLSYKPAEKNRTAKQLVDHFVSHVEDLVEAVETGVLNHRVMADYPTTENAIEVFEKVTARSRFRSVSCTRKTAAKPWIGSRAPRKKGVSKP